MFLFKIKFLLSCAFILLGSAQAFAFSEDDIKAAYIYNFTKFITWPEGKSQNMIFCFHGDIKNSAPYMQLSKKNIHVQRATELSSAQGCSIWYVGNLEESKISELSNYAVQNAILLVGDSDTFVDKKGMIGLVFNDNKISFEVNYLKVKEAKLSVSAKLMALAKRVITD